MPLIKKTVSITGTEMDFIEALYDALLEIDDITLSPPKSDIGNFFVDTSAGYSFTLIYKNAIQLVFTRENNIGTITYLRFSISVTDSTMSTSIPYWYFTSSNCLYTTETTRTAKFIFAISEHAVEMIFLRNDATSDFAVTWQDGSSGRYYNPYFVFIPISENGTTNYLCKYSISNFSNISDLTFYELGESTPYTIAKNFNYACPNYGIQMRDSSTLLSNSERVADIEGLINCTTVPINTVLTIGNKEYFSMGTDCIVEI